MKEHFVEHRNIFLNIIKWVILAVVIGIAVGLLSTLFLKVLKVSTSFANGYEYYFLALPITFVICSWLINKLAPQSKGHGTEKVIEAVHKRAGKIPLAVVPIKLFTTIATIASGGSVGKEGPCGQIGAAMSSTLSDFLHLNISDRRKLVICGISAGFAAVFGTPISGAIFGLEVLFIGAIMYDVMLPSFISGIVAYQVCSALGITYFHSRITFSPVFSESFFLNVLIAGVIMGLISFILIESFKFLEKIVHKWKWNEYVKNFSGGVLLIFLTFLVSQKYLGLGTSIFETALNGSYHTFWYDFLLKILFTIVTLSFGGSGGVVTPIFFIGATAGCLFAQILGLDTATFAAIGMVSLLSGTTNTPIAASIMGLELFGPTIAPYAAIGCIISFLMTGHRSIYPSQILSMSKSTSMDVGIGKEVSNVEMKIIVTESENKWIKRFLSYSRSEKYNNRTRE
jgi:H+/Cl- antiporter ClcA